MLLCIYPSKILNIASVCGDYDAEQKYPTFISHRLFVCDHRKACEKNPTGFVAKGDSSFKAVKFRWPCLTYVRELLCCFETLIYTLTRLTYEYFILTVKSRLKAQTADQIQKWNQSAEAGSPDHKGNQCVRSAGRVLWQQFSQDTCFNKTWINTMDVLHTSWVSFLIKFTDQPVIVSRPAGVIQCTVWWRYTWL